MIGNVPFVLRQIKEGKGGNDHYLHRLYMKYGPILKMRMLGKKASSFNFTQSADYYFCVGNSWSVIVASPEAFETVFRAEGKYPSRGYFEDNMMWLYKKLGAPPPMFFSYVMRY